MFTPDGSPQGGDLSPDEYQHAMVSPVSLGPWRSGEPSAESTPSKEDECWDCLKLKAENKCQLAEITRLRRELAILRLFEDSGTDSETHNPVQCESADGYNPYSTMMETRIGTANHSASMGTERVD